MKTVLVTGAAGFLGSHLAMYHLEAGDKVVGVDNFCSSAEDSDHLKALKAFETFRFLEKDVCEDTKTWHGLPAEQIDLIYNFACPASPPAYQSMPISTMMACTVGTANMLDLAFDHKCVLVHASTSEVYGDPDCSPQPENYRGNVNSYGPRACYDEGKRAAEALCFDYHKSCGVDARLVRIFNTYGPHMDPYDGRVISNFIRQALSNEPLTVYGHGQQGRSFCYVDDLIRGVVALGALTDNPLTPINLGNPIEYKVCDLAEIIAQKLNCGRLVLRRDAMPIDDPTQRCPDLTRARDILKWNPIVTLDQGLDKTIAYFKSAMVNA